MSDAILKTDGGSRGNPGLAGLGYVLADRDGRVISEGGWPLGQATNNVAEYSALIWGLQNAFAAKVDRLSVYADSELVVKQMNGAYQVKSNDLKPLYLQAKSLFSRFNAISLEHVYRNDNKEADRLANEAMDARRPVGSYMVPWEASPVSLFDAERPEEGGEAGAKRDSLAGDRVSGGSASARVDSETINEDDEGTRSQSAGCRNGGSLQDALKESESMEKNERYNGPHRLSGESYEHAGGHYEMTLKDHFDAAHTLPGYDGPCRYLHGHTWDVEVTVAGEHLDEVGILYDFKDLKRDLHAVLENFDHRYINDTPPFDVVNPTAENLARVVFYELEKTFPEGVYLQEVAIWESPVARIAYRP